MKTIIKCLAWMAALFTVALAMVYAMYLILVFWLFGRDLYLGLAIAGLVVLFVAYWQLVRIAEC